MRGVSGLPRRLLIVSLRDLRGLVSVNRSVASTGHEALVRVGVAAVTAGRRVPASTLRALMRGGSSGHARSVNVGPARWRPGICAPGRQRGWRRHRRTGRCVWREEHLAGALVSRSAIAAVTERRRSRGRRRMPQVTALRSQPRRSSCSGTPPAVLHREGGLFRRGSTTGPRVSSRGPRSRMPTAMRRPTTRAAVSVDGDFAPAVRRACRGGRPRSPSPAHATHAHGRPSAAATSRASDVLPTLGRADQAENGRDGARVRQAHGDVVDEALLHRPCIRHDPHRGSP